MKGQVTNKYETTIINQQQRSRPKNLSTSVILVNLLLLWHNVVDAKLSRKTYSVWDITKTSSNNTKESVPDSDASTDASANINKGDLEQTLENFKRSIFIDTRHRNKKSYRHNEYDAPVIYIPNIGKIILFFVFSQLRISYMKHMYLPWKSEFLFSLSLHLKI